MIRLVAFLSLVSLITLASTSFVKAETRSPVWDPELQVAVPGPGVVLTSSVSKESLHRKENAGPDTFALFGYDTDDSGTAPFAAEARFQDPLTGTQPDKSGWISVDLTDLPVFWQISEFNASNLDGQGAGNQAAWCGLSAAQQPGWQNAPGYGNNWFDILLYEVQVPDASVGQTVDLDFFFNHDTEPGYDYFRVQYDSAGQWMEVLSLDGSNKDGAGVFQAPGVPYSTSGANPIVYAGNDYGFNSDSAAFDLIRIRIVVSSDGAWSDEDGLWPTDGAAQVDDISVSSTAGISFTDFETGYGAWAPDKAPFAGDFFDAYARMNDLDPCRSNDSPVGAFIDRDQVVNNAASAALIPGYPVQTGGTTSSNWSYGFPGGWVVNYNGGLSFGQLSLRNEIWSHELDWDLPGTEDDGQDVAGAFIAFDRWTHLPLLNGIFYVWHVRSSSDGVTWTPWNDTAFVYYGGGVASWGRTVRDVSGLLLPGPQKVQMALGLTELAVDFGFPGDDATPSPVFDNAAFVKYRIQGPAITTRQIDLANDGFPPSGSIDASTQSARNALDIPFDMSRDINVGTANTPGDSIIADVISSIPGATVTDIRMKWALLKNPFFEDAIRTVPSRIKDQNVDASDPAIWFGEVVADTVIVPNGAIIDDRYAMDLPDVDFLYPGDVLHYFVEATDSGGRVTTLPGDTSGFGVLGGGYNRSFIVRGLPSIRDAVGDQPSLLVWNDFGRRGGENEFLLALGQNGLHEGEHYDVYTTNGPSSGVSNGLGSAGAHGANAGQLAGYDRMLVLTGNLSTFLFSNGSNVGQNDKGDDLGVLTGWKALSGPRASVYFGDYIASANVNDSAEGGVYVQTVMGVLVNDSYVGDEIDGQTAPLVRPVNAAFAKEFVAYGGCLAINQFDSITALAPAFRAHGFVSPANAVYPSIAASVVHDRLEGGDRKVDVTFPFGMPFVYDSNTGGGTGLSARSILLREVFDYFGQVGAGPVVDAPVSVKSVQTVFPTPFNAHTTVRLTLDRTTELSTRIYNLRGELVRTLFEGEFEGGAQLELVWDGRDAKQASVASGVYLVRTRSRDGQVDLRTKVALVK